MSDTDVRIELCTDCVHLHANGEVPHEYNEDEVTLYLEIVQHNTAGFYAIVTCHEREDGDDCDPGMCEDGHISFSRSRCGSCGTYLAGDRCPGVLAELPGDDAAALRESATRMRTWNGNDRIEQ